MSLLSKIFKYILPEERVGISLEQGPCWEVSRIEDLPSFLRALIDLVPLESTLYLEGNSISKDIQLYLEARKPQQITKVETGTIWPHPKCFHMAITYESLDGLAQLADKHAEPEIADHLHIYKDNKIILQWYDAFSDPFYISKEILEDKVKNFCSRLNTTYKIGEF